jgi:hypothetical protein
MSRSFKVSKDCLRFSLAACTSYYWDTNPKPTLIGRPDDSVLCSLIHDQFMLEFITEDTIEQFSSHDEIASTQGPKGSQAKLTR